MYARIMCLSPFYDFISLFYRIGYKIVWVNYYFDTRIFECKIFSITFGVIIMVVFPPSRLAPSFIISHYCAIFDEFPEFDFNKVPR